MEYSENALHEIRLYFACNFLYKQGRSHPQVVETLSEYEEDHKLVVSVADKAQIDLWRSILNKFQELTSEGLQYDEILKRVGSMEEDPEILDFICNIWYKVKTVYVDNLVESEGNLLLGMKWVSISALILITLYFIHASIVTKIIWYVMCFLSMAIWLYGARQKKVAHQLEQILKYDFSKFDKLI